MPAATYPISLPTATGTASITIKQRSLVALGVSPFSLAAQSQVWPGQMWLADLVLPPMVRAKGEVWQAALVSLNGQEGSILLGDTANKTPRGSVSGTPVVNGAGQTGYSLNTRGWTLSAAGVLKAGDWVQLGTGNSSRLYKVLADVNADAGGLAAVPLWPQLRASPADGQTLITSNTVGRFMLAKEPPPVTIDKAHLYHFAVLSFMEDLRP